MMTESLRVVWNWTRDEKTNCLNKLFLSLVIFSGLQTTGLSLDSHPPRSGASVVGSANPYLEPIKYNTTVFVGQTTYLTCLIHNLGDKTVSWIRKRDLHILTSGNQIYTNDKRFSLLREGKLMNAWTLKISSVAKKDEGTYECQINTDPKMTAMLHLIVLGSLEEDPGSAALALGMLDSPYHQRDDHQSNVILEAKILGPSVVELEQGHPANFTCIIAHGGPQPNISWFFNEIPIQKAKGGLSVNTEKSSYTTISQLVILKPQSGKYSCGGATVYPDSVVLKVRPHHHSNSRNSRWKDELSSTCRMTTSSTWLPVLLTFCIYL